MRNSRILIFGRIGQVGWELRHKLACLGQFSTVEYPEVDFTNSDSIRSALRIEPAVIVNTVAYMAVDKAESEPQRATAINATGPGRAYWPKKPGCWAACWCTTRPITSSTEAS